jgi:hypothetical protein
MSLDHDELDHDELNHDELDHDELDHDEPGSRRASNLAADHSRSHRTFLP